jgi:hypothetical protein
MAHTVILPYQRLREEDHKFKARPDDIARPCLKASTLAKTKPKNSTKSKEFRC